jgi:hypothetical protein
MAAKKSAGTGSGTGSKKTVKSVKTVSSTAVRNSPIPKAPPAPSATSAAGTATTAAPRSAATHQQITQEQIAKRAYEIWRSGKGGSAFENWIRAERELRAQYSN